MEKQDIRFIENPFEKIFNIILPDKNKLYSLLIRLIEQFFKNVNIPTLSDLASDPKEQYNDFTAYSGAGGYLYMMIRCARYFGKQKMGSFIQFSNSSELKDGELNKFMDPQFYIQRAIEQYKMNQMAAQKNPSKQISFLGSQVCTWVCGMHIGYDTRNHALFRQNEARLIQVYKTILKQSKNVLWQLLYGVPGFLYAILQIQSQYDSVTEELFKTNFSQISMDLTRKIIQNGISSYQAESKTVLDLNKKIPQDFRLVYHFHKSEYLGGAHGLGGNLNIILMSMSMNKFSQQDINFFIKVMHPSIIFLLKNFINGNFPTRKGSQKIKLVHFCHGAPGIINCLARYAELYPEKGIQLGLNQVVKRALDHVWKYGVLKKGFGLCHGISGNAYAFLSKSVCDLIPQKAEQYKKKALLFGLLRQEEGVMTEIGKFDFKDRLVTGKSDNPFSLMLGIAGDICFAIDAFEGKNNFPGFNIDS